MLTSIDVKFIFDSACLSACLGDNGLFSFANIFRITDPEMSSVELSSCCSCYVFRGNNNILLTRCARS